MPKHVAIIMDGNGRWAERQGLHRSLGHKEGSGAVRKIVRESRKLGIRALTLYAFSEQNWQRPQDEVKTLMTLLRDYLENERQELLQNQIRLRAIGRLDRLPPPVRFVLDQLMNDTLHMSEMTLTLALSYGGQEEILDATKSLVHQVIEGNIQADDIDEKMFEQHLPSMDVGPVDLLIRTGGEQRISNFLLWGASYAEFFFSEKLWPDMTERDLHQALEVFAKRERRYGQVLPPSSHVPMHDSQPMQSTDAGENQEFKRVSSFNLR